MTNPRYAPEARLTAGSAALPAALHASIISISLQTGIDGVDRLEVRFANENLQWLDHPLLAMGGELRLALGYAPDPLEQVFVGDIVGQTPTFPAEGIPTLTVVAHDRRERMQRGTKTRWFAVSVSCVGTFPIPDLLITGGVAAENHLLLAADPISLAISTVLGGVTYATQFSSPEGKQEMVRKQRGESDFDFVGRIARENGWAMTIDHAGSLGGNVLRFTSLFSPRPPDATLRYGESLIEFSPRFTKVGEITSVSARFWLPQAKMELNVTTGWDWDRQSLSVQVVPSAGLPSGLDSTLEAATAGLTGEEKIAAEQSFNESFSKATQQKGPSYTIAGQAVTAGTAARVILGKLLPKLNQRLTGSGSTVGNLRMRPGAVLAIEGVGRQFSGPYRLTAVNHTLDASGFRTSFEVRKELWLDPASTLQDLERRAAAVRTNPGRELAEVVG